MIAISKQFTSLKISLLHTNYYGHIIMNKGTNLFVDTYYRWHIYDQYSIDQLNLSLQKLCGLSSNSKIWLAGDFNIPYID